MMDSGDSQVVRVVVGLLGLGLIIFLRMWFQGTKTITRPDGTLKNTEGGAATEASTPHKRQIGPTTVSFAYINERHAMVNGLKQKYGNAVRIVHRGRKPEWGWSGSRNLYTLIYEVPAKCPKCKEAFSIEDFGFVDCPGCGLELAVGFDDVTRKKVVMPANSEALAAPRPQRPASAPLPEADAREETNDPIADRFGKIE
jgi:hypothetical protein